MIQENYFLICVVALTLGTVFIRGSFIAFSSKMNISGKVKELFSFIPAAIFPALIVPVTFFHQGNVEWIGGKERFLVLLASGIACYFIRNTLFVISFGLILLYLVSNYSLMPLLLGLTVSPN